MPNQIPSPKPGVQKKQTLRIVGIVVPLVLLLSLFVIQQSPTLSGLLGISATLTGNDFDGDGVPDDIDIDDDNDGIPDEIEGRSECYGHAMVNGGFEEGPYPSKYTQTNESNVNGWETTAPDNKIEIWKSGFLSVPSHEGDHHVEINSSHHAALFQIVCTRPGSVVSWSIWHRGRSGVDVAQVRIGGDFDTATVAKTMSSGTSAWVQYTDTFTVPDDQHLTYFIFESISTAGGKISVGNFIDNLELTEISYDLTVDSDMDGIPDHLDLDSDNDGIPDIVEAGGADTDGDGMADNQTDTDGDGLADIFDNDPTDGPLSSGCTLGTDCDLGMSTSALLDMDADGTNEESADFDKDGIPNYRDIDADDDGIVDNIEGQPSVGYVPPTGYDDDQDGLDNAYDTDCNGACTASDGSSLNVAGVALVPTNTDGVDNPDYLDKDADNDGETDMTEAYDTDNDGSADTNPVGYDTDMDGMDDGFDLNNMYNSATQNSSNGLQTSSTFPDMDGGGPDWRDSGSSFPVEWLSFDAQLSGGQATIQWATASETNSDFFDVERSEDGIGFEAIGREYGQGTTQQATNYAFTDANLPSARTLYYRLRQVDLDGSFSYSNVEQLSMDSPTAMIEISLAPNPARDFVTLRYSQPQTGSVPFNVLSLTGQKVYSGSLTENRGELQINVSSWPSGTYIIQVAGRSKGTDKLIVAH